MPKKSRTLDKQKLVQHLEHKREHSNLLVYAVLEGLRTAIVRGDFDIADEEEEVDDGDAVPTTTLPGLRQDTERDR
jgi:hypothetical protein